MIDENSTLEEIQEYFKADKFATNAGCEVVSAKPGDAVVKMPITPDHLNANGTVMGGAMFTVADFAVAVASNSGDKNSVGIAATCQFFRASQGTTLFAHGYAQKDGRSVGFYTIDVTDDQDKDIARFTFTMHNSPRK